MLRALLVIVALAIIAVIVLAATGMISLRQTQEAQAPAFDVNVKQVGVGTTTTNVQVPTVGMETKQIEVPTVTVGESGQANQQ
jgi:Na+-transporting NADH:ubiquinone oxidoreductase subunit NqrC